MSPEEKPPEDSDSDAISGAFGDSPNVDSPKSAENPLFASSESGQPENADSPGRPADATVVDDATIVEETVVDMSAPVVAEMAESAGDALSVGGGAALNPTLYASIPAPAIAGNLEKLSANGGAIGSLVLGVWCVIGSFITNWSIINGVIGLLMGFWGLTSRKQRTAWIGIALCVTGIFMSLIQVNELINMYMNAVDETPY